MTTTALAFLPDLSQKTRLSLFLLATILSALIFVFQVVRANTLSKKQLKLKGNRIKIFYGDIFHQDCLKVIPFNEFFDTDIKAGIISKRSLNGLFLEKFGKDKINDTIRRDKRLKSKIVRTDAPRPNGGKKTKYKLGSICRCGDYALLAFSRFDDENKACLSLEEYITCLMNFWSEVDATYNGESVAVPLLGSGITRIESNKLSPQDNLQLLLWTLKISGLRLRPNAELKIVLSTDLKDEINLFRMEGELNGLQK